MPTIAELRRPAATAARAPRWVLSGAKVPKACLPPDLGSTLPLAGDGLILADIEIRGPTIAALRMPEAPGPSALDLRGAIVWPGLVDCHTHLDKGHIWPRSPNPDGSFWGAIEATARDRTAHWTGQDIARRMDFALRSAHAHGTVAIRTHLDTEPRRMAEIWEAFRQVQADWAGRITLQAACLIGTEDILDEDYLGLVLDQLRRTPGAVLGAFVKAFAADQAALPDRLRRFMAVAEAEGLALDFHVDETLDPGSRGLALVAEAALATGHQGPILCGHGCALSVYPPDQLARTIEQVAAAGIGLVSLPLCNAYLQDRAQAKSPRLRGPAPVHELRAGGVATALGSDNTRDPFHAYGDLDLLELYRMATLLQHLDHPVGDWPAAITATPARLTGLPGGLLGPGVPADLIVTRARTWSETIARPVERLVIRDGHPLDATPPDYADLDDLEGFAHAADL